MNPHFGKLQESDIPQLAKWLTSHRWPWHTHTKLSSEQVQGWINDGRFTKKENETCWILSEDKRKIGLSCLQDISDTYVPYPEFEIWIADKYRTTDVVSDIVGMMRNKVFQTYPHVIGLRTQMRRDDAVMRQVCRKNLFAKEACRRRSWPIGDGGYCDSVEYGVLKEDWEQGTVTAVRWDDEHSGAHKQDEGRRQNKSITGISFRQFVRTEAVELAELLSSETWLHYIHTNSSKEQVLEWIEKGRFDGDEQRTFWIIRNNTEKVGMVRLYALRDELPYSPQIDIRIRSRHQGQGIGKATISWLTEHVFTNLRDKVRIEGYTRKLNVAMRRVFLKCGYAKEGHFRNMRNTVQKNLVYDIVGYGITREDWEGKKVTPVNWYEE